MLGADAFSAFFKLILVDYKVGSGIAHSLYNVHFNTEGVSVELTHIFGRNAHIGILTVEFIFINSRILIR